MYEEKSSIFFALFYKKLKKFYKKAQKKIYLGNIYSERRNYKYIIICNKEVKNDGNKN